jgi:hypothetical protein
MSPVKYELGFHIPEDGILHSHRCQNLKSCTVKNVLNFTWIVGELTLFCTIPIFLLHWSGCLYISKDSLAGFIEAN